jgi:uncharacterized integral membrane protein (TIGR00698 family)
MLSPIILAMVIGMGVRAALGAMPLTRPGLGFAARWLLRLAIVLLGFQVTLTQMAQLGVGGVAIICAGTFATFSFTIWIGRLLGIDASLARLLAAGTSICGASAILAANHVVRAKDEDAAYAIGCITLFGTIAIFLYPVLAVLAGLDARIYGLWAGASIHEIAQVVAATFQLGQSAGEYGTISKLARVALLVPILALLSATVWDRLSSQATAPAQRQIPFFALGFLAVVVANSTFEMPAGAREWLSHLTTFLFAMSLGAMGMELRLRHIASRGLRPLAVAAFASLFIAAFSLTALKIFL